MAPPGALTAVRAIESPRPRPVRSRPLRFPNDLAALQERARTIVAGLPAITDQAERRKRLEAAAADVLKEWKKYNKKSLPKFALDALVETAEIEWPKIVSTGGLLAVEQTRWVGAGAGIALLAHKGVKVLGKYRKHRNVPRAIKRATPPHTTSRTGATTVRWK